MADKITAQTSTLFVIQMMTSENTAVEVTVVGANLRYDAENGFFTSGQVASVSISDLALVGRHLHQVSIRQVAGIDFTTDKMAEVFGEKTWNCSKVVLDGFDKLIGISPTSAYAYFATDKSEIKMTEFGDHFTGSRFADVIDGLAGDDFFYGAKGDDTLAGGKGNDTLDGGVGNDVLLDVEGRNRLIGGNGNDSLRGGQDSDTFLGGKGNDVIFGHGGSDLAAGGAGRDVFVFDLNERGRLIIQDFNAKEFLVNMQFSSPDEAYRDFMEHARMVGRSTVYEEGGMVVQLNNFNLRELTPENFAVDGHLTEFVNL